MIELKASDCGCVLAVMVAGLSLHFYSAGEFLATLMLSGFVILLLGLALLSVFFVWHASMRAAAWFRVVRPIVPVIPLQLAPAASLESTGWPRGCETGRKEVLSRCS